LSFHKLLIAANLPHGRKSAVKTPAMTNRNSQIDVKSMRNVVTTVRAKSNYHRLCISTKP